MNINIKIEKLTRNVFLSKYIIGNDGENLQGNFVFTFDDFVDGQAMLFYEIDGESRYDYLKKENETYVLPIKTAVTKQGTIPMQLVIYEGIEENEVPIFKTNVFKVKVGRSIEDGIEQPEEYPSWLEIANTKLNEIDNLDISIKDGVVTIIKKDGTTESENVKGEPNTLTIGEVVTGDIAQATITGEAPNQILNLVLPKGDTGAPFTYDMFTEEQLEDLKGVDGVDGKDGISPLATVTQTGTGATITIEDKNGTTTANIVNGKDGKDGEKGEAFTYEDFTKEQLNSLRGKDGNGISSITRYYLATDTIGGSEVIEWDGDITGCENFEYFYKVSDEIFSKEELLGQTVEMADQSFTIDKFQDIEGNNFGATSSQVTTFPALVVVVTETTSNFPFSTGTYFLRYQGAYYVSKLTVAGGGISTDTEGWTTEIQTMTPTNKYLLSYEVVDFTDGTNNTSEPVIIGVYGDKGADGQTPDMSFYYTKEETNEVINNAIGTVLEGSY